MRREMVDFFLGASSGQRLLLGNEAIVRGALEGGLEFAAAYPGTPASEIGDVLADLSVEGGPPFSWTVNEKVALEMTAAAAACGLRALTAMKHVGLNVAADALMTAAYVGTVAGLVIVTADDPSCHSSQNEQDNRYYARLAGLPLVEPSCPQEARDMARAAFALSENLSLPVLLRTTTRVAHTRAPVVAGPVRRGPPGGYAGAGGVAGRWAGRFTKDPRRWVAMPASAREAHAALLGRLEQARRAATLSVFNQMTLVETGDGERRRGQRVGILASGVARAYARETLDRLGSEGPLSVLLLELGFSYPVPHELIARLVSRADRILVVEELEPLLEQETLAIAAATGRRVKVLGKLTGDLPRCQEYTPELVDAAVAELLGRASPAIGSGQQSGARSEGVAVAAPPRPPVLCPGCPHRHTYYAARRAARIAAKRLGAPMPVFPTDIGCYTLGIAKPYEMADYMLCMGSSLGSGCAFATATPHPVLSFIGDSTFFHAGLPGLAQAVHGHYRLTLVVLDNRTTAMTGHQPHPGAGAGSHGAGPVEVSIEDVARGFGVPWVRVVDPNDLRATQQAIQDAMLSGGPAVVVARAACILLEVAEKRRRGQRVVPYAIDAERCTACMACVRQFGCPAIVSEDGRASVDGAWCNGCGVCVQVCPAGAIRPAAGEGPEGGSAE